MNGRIEEGVEGRIEGRREEWRESERWDCLASPFSGVGWPGQSSGARFRFVPPGAKPDLERETGIGWGCCRMAGPGCESDSVGRKRSPVQFGGCDFF